MFTLELCRWDDNEADLRAVRTTVFIEEQAIPEHEEWDEMDAVSVHLIARLDGRAVGTGRLLPDGRIGRMAVLQEARRTGLGSAILQRLMAAASGAGHKESTLNAQVAVMPFYAAHGFQPEGEVFDECGIPHQRMRAPLQTAKAFVPHLTVAAVIEHAGQFLLVEEMVQGRPVLNQPAGHVEAHETLVDAIVREVLEETGYRFIPEAILGLYEWPRPDGETYLRVAFRGRVEGLPRAEIDPDILRTVWLDAAAMTSAGAARPSRLRSGLVLQCLADYQAGRSLPLDTVRTWRGRT